MHVGLQQQFGILETHRGHETHLRPNWDSRRCRRHCGGRSQASQTCSSRWYSCMLHASEKWQDHPYKLAQPPRSRRSPPSRQSSSPPAAVGASKFWNVMFVVGGREARTLEESTSSSPTSWLTVIRSL